MLRFAVYNSNCMYYDTSRQISFALIINKTGNLFHHFVATGTVIENGNGEFIVTCNWHNMCFHACKFLVFTSVPLCIVTKRTSHTTVIFALIYVITAVIFQFRTFVKINFGCIKTLPLSII